jgi:predicted CDP-diglyceride synthetase/phosphatidate cytidylyltransferase
VVKPKKVQRHRTMISMTMDPEVLRSLRDHVAAEQITLSGFIEDLVIAALKREKR